MKPEIRVITIPESTIPVVEATFTADTRNREAIVAALTNAANTMQFPADIDAAFILAQNEARDVIVMGGRFTSKAGEPPCDMRLIIKLPPRLPSAIEASSDG